MPDFMVVPFVAVLVIAIIAGFVVAIFWSPAGLVAFLALAAILYGVVLLFRDGQRLTGLVLIVVAIVVGGKLVKVVPQQWHLSSHSFSLDPPARF